MALPLRLPTPVADRRKNPPLIVAVEAAALVAGIGALALLSSEQTILILIGVLLVAVTGFALVLSRPSVIVELAIVTMWFDSVGAGPIRTGRVVVALAIAILFARVAASDWRPPALMPRAWIMPAIFYFWAVVTGFWSAEIGTWITGMMELTLGFIYGLIIMLYIENEKHLARCFKMWVWTGVPIAIISYVFFRKIDTVQEDIGGENRIVGFTGNANAYALLLAVAVPVTVVFIRRAKTRGERVLYSVFTFGFLVALVTTGSRAGLIAMGALALYIFVTFPGLDRRQRVWSSVLGVVFVAVGVFLAGLMNPDRYSIAAFFADAGAGRLELWNAAITSLGKRPVFGFSIGAFRTQMLDALSKAPDGTMEITRSVSNRSAGQLEVHNTYLTMMLDLGIIGLVIYLTMVANVFRNLWDLRNTQWRDWSWALFGAMGAFAISAFFASDYNLKFVWTIVGVSGAGFVRYHNTGRTDRVRRHRGLPALRESVRPAEVPAELAFSGERAFAAPTDLRLRYPFRWVLALFVLVGFFGGFIGAKAFGTPRYSAYGRVLVLPLDQTDPRGGVGVDEPRIQFVLNIARSERYLAEVRKRAGLTDRYSLAEMATLVDSTRPKFGPIVRVTARTADPDVTRRLGAVLIPALDGLVDSARAGSVVVVSADQRATSPDADPDYRGPLYLHLFDDPITTESAPRAFLCGIIGATLGMLVVVIGSMLLHTRRRLTSAEDIGEILQVPIVGSIPRPVGGASRKSVALYRALGDQIDRVCADTPRVVAWCSNDLLGLQGRVTVGAAAGLATTTDRPIVVVDLDVRSRSLSRQLGMRRRAGIIDVALAAADAGIGEPSSPTLDDVRRRLPRWRLPRAFRRLTKDRPDQLTVIPVGGRKQLRDPSVVVDETVLALLVGQLATESLVVLNLPPVPGPLPIRELLLLSDAVLLDVLDGWSEIDPAQTTIDALEAAVPNRVGYVLIDQ